MNREEGPPASGVLVSVLIPTLNEAVHIDGAIEMVQAQQDLQGQCGVHLHRRLFGGRDEGGLGARE